MTIQQRNSIFDEYRNVIKFTVYRHRSFLKTLRMEAEDLEQELAIRLLKAIERYDPARGAKPSTYYFKSLRYEVLDLWREQMRQKRLANLWATPLTYSNGDGEEIELELRTEVDYDTDLLVQEFMKTLSISEQNALAHKLDGSEPDDKRQKRYMKIIRRKALRFLKYGGM